jgi:endonuclease/exonuclease/phosphatase family metal-dependent hydrolase
MLGAMLKPSLALSVFATLTAVGALGCDDGGSDTPGLPVKVFTHNLYLGSDLTKLALVNDPAKVPALTAELWGNVQASDFPARAKVLAAQIVAAAPDLVALQEVTLYRRQFPSDYQPGDAVPNATEVALDFLDALMTELDAAGGGYTVAGVATNADAEFPVADPGGMFDLRVTDRDVILARDTVETANFTQVDYPTRFSITVGGAGGVPATFTRSTSHLDAVVGGAAFTFANGHLEIQSIPPVHAAQAQELVDAYADVADPVLLLGDFNADPGDAEYDLITGQFTDAWTKVGGGNGATCCQADDLMNPTSSALSRIDLVTYRGAFKPKKIEVVGADPATGRTPGGLWPSDHFGVLSTLELPL